MGERSLLSARQAPRTITAAVDVVLLTPRDGSLAALLMRTADPRARERWLLPWDAPRLDESPEDAGQRVARSVLGAPTALDQIGAFGDGRRHPGSAQLSIAFVGLVPFQASERIADAAAVWVDVRQLPLMAPRHRAIVDSAIEVVRRRIDQAPLAFRLLPQLFTLSELQSIYELLLGRSLHKASFRRALQAASLVEPTEEWRSEGRGRPAQLYRYAPRRKRGARRSVRFDLIETI